MNDPGAMPELIIDRPELQPRIQRTVFGTLTLLAWSAYIYLWMPLVTLGAWWLSVRIGRGEFSTSPAPFVDVELFILLLKAASLAIAMMIGWAEYNRLRFQGKERRGARPLVSPEQSAQALGVTEGVAQRLRGARHATVVLDAHALARDLREHAPLDDAPTVRR